MRHAVGQTSLALFDDDVIDPITCPHRLDFPLPHVSRCMAHDGTFVNCTKDVCGDGPMCCYVELDNSPEARERRLKWIEKHGLEVTA